MTKKKKELTRLCCFLTYFLSLSPSFLFSFFFLETFIYSMSVPHKDFPPSPEDESMDTFEPTLLFASEKKLIISSTKREKAKGRNEEDNASRFAPEDLDDRYFHLAYYDDRPRDDQPYNNTTNDDGNDGMFPKDDMQSNPTPNDDKYSINDDGNDGISSMDDVPSNPT